MSRLLGGYYRPRDERGWLIPAAGTQARKVYSCLLAGMRPKQIIKLVGCSPATVYSALYAIRRPERALANYRRAYANRRKKRWRRESTHPHGS